MVIFFHKKPSKEVWIIAKDGRIIHKAKTSSNIYKFDNKAYMLEGEPTFIVDGKEIYVFEIDNAVPLRLKDAKLKLSPEAFSSLIIAYARNIAEEEVVGYLRLILLINIVVAGVCFFGFYYLYNYISTEFAKQIIAQIIMELKKILPSMAKPI